MAQRQLMRMALCALLAAGERDRETMDFVPLRSRKKELAAAAAAERLEVPRARLAHEQWVAVSAAADAVEQLASAAAARHQHEVVQEQAKEAAAVAVARDYSTKKKRQEEHHCGRHFGSAPSAALAGTG
jgi:hypothetical protein